MKNLQNASKKLRYIFFAKDTGVFMEPNNLDYVLDMLNIELEKLSIWLSSSKLTLNIDKSHFVIFYRARLKQNNASLNRVNLTKFLGVIIDKLLFSRHTSHIIIGT